MTPQLDFESSLKAIPGRVSWTVRDFGKHVPRWRTRIEKDKIKAAIDLLTLCEQVFGSLAAAPYYVIRHHLWVRRGLAVPDFGDPGQNQGYEDALMAEWDKYLISQDLYEALKKCQERVQFGIKGFDRYGRDDWPDVVTEDTPLAFMPDGLLNLCTLVLGTGPLPESIIGKGWQVRRGMAAPSILSATDRHLYREAILAEWDEQVRYLQLRLTIRRHVATGIRILNENGPNRWRRYVDTNKLAYDTGDRLNLLIQVYGLPELVPDHWSLPRLGLAVPILNDPTLRTWYRRELIAEWHRRIGRPSKQKRKARSS